MATKKAKIEEANRRAREIVAKRGPGRPPGAKNKAPHEQPPREFWLRVRVREAERDAIAEAAQATHMNLSDYLRKRLGLELAEWGEGAN